MSCPVSNHGTQMEQAVFKVYVLKNIAKSIQEEYSFFFFFFFQIRLVNFPAVPEFLTSYTIY